MGLITRAQEIRDETLANANTATRVGGLLEDMIPTVETVSTATANVSATQSGKIFHVTYTATGSCTITVLSAAIAISGFLFHVKDAGLNASANKIVIATQGAERIDNQATLDIAGNGDAISLYSDGTNLFIF